MNLTMRVVQVTQHSRQVMRHVPPGRIPTGSFFSAARALLITQRSLSTNSLNCFSHPFSPGAARLRPAMLTSLIMEDTSFFQGSTAGNATITTNAGGVTSFFGESTGGNAAFITNAGGIVDISGLGTFPDGGECEPNVARYDRWLDRGGGDIFSWLQATNGRLQQSLDDCQRDHRGWRCSWRGRRLAGQGRHGNPDH